MRSASALATILFSLPQLTTAQEFGVVTAHVLAKDSSGEEWQLVRGQLLEVVGKIDEDLLVRGKYITDQPLRLKEVYFLSASRFRRVVSLPSCTAGEYIGECNYRFSAKADGTYTSESWCGDARTKQRSSGQLYALGPYLLARERGSGAWQHGFALDGEGNRTCESK